MTLYSFLKHTHVTAVVISALMFSYRFYRLQRYPQIPLARMLKWVPHINDTLLLGAAVGMLVVTGLSPLRLPWLCFKLVLLPVYIGLGAVCLRAPPGSGRQIILFVSAALVYLAIAVTALTKNAHLVG